ncbi:hypothetical protein ACA910_014529 [Epithemia clementina (nom. ined.)]
MTQLSNQHGVTKWAIGGHSAGGNTAASLVRKQLLPTNITTKVLLWGVGTTQDLAQSAADVQALCITASNDVFRKNSLGKGLKTFDHWGQGDWARLKHIEIQGGNHGGFADYPPQTYPRVDGTRTITLAEQHEQVVQATAEFLLAKHK